MRALGILILMTIMSPVMLLGTFVNMLFRPKGYTHSVGVAYSEALATIFFRVKDETFSSYVGRGIIRGEYKFKILGFIIDSLMGKDHCIKSVG